MGHCGAGRVLIREGQRLPHLPTALMDEIAAKMSSSPQKARRPEERSPGEGEIGKDPLPEIKASIRLSACSGDVQWPIKANPQSVA